MRSASPAKQVDLFTAHSRHWQANRYVYPVVSRRSKGLSVGVNLNPDTVCNFDCIYCSVDRSKPANLRHVDLDVLRGELDAMVRLAVDGTIWNQPPFDGTAAPLRRFNDIAFSGDGEPTSFKHFLEACEIAADVLSSHGPATRETKIVVITNATLLHRPKVRAALKYLDGHNGEVWAKLDAGTEDYYRAVERTSVPMRRVLENIASAGRERPLVIQSLFMKISGEPPADDEITAYVNRLHDLIDSKCRVKLVQVYTTARDTAEKFVTPLSNKHVDAIAARVRAIGLDAEAFYGPT